MNTNKKSVVDIKIDMEDMLLADSMPFNQSVMHAALCYVNNGVPVIPLEKNSKKLHPNGVNYTTATLKSDTVLRWFGKDGKYEGCNIGIACGTTTGVMALDVDSKPVLGSTGIKEISILIEKNGPLPVGPEQHTPSGGFHRLYKWQEGAVSSSSKIGRGLDTRGGTNTKYTGHIVAYPSIIDGKQYSWSSGGEVPEMPDWLVAMLGTPWKDKKVAEQAKTEVPFHQTSRMLAAIDVDLVSYEDWVKVGMALKTMYGEDGLELWDGWSELGARRVHGECRSKWKTFNDDGEVGFGTFKFIAKDFGWSPLPGDIVFGTTEDMVEEHVIKMNKRYAVMRMGKGVMIVTFEKNPSDTRVGFLATQSFSILMQNEKIMVDDKFKSLADIWMASPSRLEYHDMGIYPNNDHPSNTLNMWNGWLVEPDEHQSCKHYLDHMLNIICSGDMKLYNWLLDWMADCVQDSRNIKGSCVVLRGIEGCGKGVWADNFGKLFGKHYTHLIDSERLTSRFNSMMSDSIIIFADEVLFPGDRKSANVLKGLVSESRVTREAKGVDPIEVDNLNRIIIASNEAWIIPAGPQSRRWLVLNVDGSMAGSKVYFDRIFFEMENGGREALLHTLMTRKITSNLRLAPETKGLLEQRMMSSGHNSLLNFLMESLEREGFDTVDAEAMVGDVPTWPKMLNRYELFNEYRAYCKDTRVSNYDVLTIPVFSNDIRKYGFVDKGRYLEVPKYSELRSTLLNTQGGNYEQ